MKRSVIRKSVRTLEAYTPGEQPRVPGLVKLNTNENPYPPSPKVAKALAGLAPRDLRLYPDPVCRNLRQVIADLHGVKLDQVFVGNGSDEILALCTRAFVEDDGEIGYFEPSYSLYPVLAAIRNVRGMATPLDDDFGWPVSGPGPGSLFFMANPNAPTSTLFPKGVVRAFCRKYPGVVLIDEAYVDFASEDCMDLAARLPNVLVMRTLSKSYSLAGIRLGYVVGPSDLIGVLFKIKDSYNVNRVTQIAAAAALSDQPYMRRNVKRIRATRVRLAAELERRNFCVMPSETNFLFARPGSGTARGMFAALKEQGILVRYFPGPRTGDFLRITIGSDEEVDQLLDALPVVRKAAGKGAKS